MCMAAPSTPSIPMDKLNQGAATLSNQKVAEGTREKTTPKRTVSSLRVPVKKTNNENTGINTANDTTVGLNIPV